MLRFVTAPRHLALALATLAAGFAACGEDTAQDSAGLAVTARSQALSDSEDLVSQDAAQTRYGLAEGLIYLRDIELDLPQGTKCADVRESLGGGSACKSQSSDSSQGSAGDKIHVPGPFVVNLVTGVSRPDIFAVQIPALTYRRVDFRLEDGDPDDGLIDAGHVLDNHSWLSRSSFTHEGQELELRIHLKFNEDLRVESAQGITVGTGEQLGLLLDPSSWLANVSITKCLEDGDLEIVDGKVTVNEDSRCSGVERTIKDNLKNSARLERRN